MKYRIDTASGTASYMQLYYQLRGDIINGIYPFGAKLPSKRLLAAEGGISVVTVEHSYAILCDEGYIEARERSGYFVIYRSNDYFSVAEPDFAPNELPDRHTSHDDFPFSVLAKTMRRVLADYGEQLMQKSPNNGCAELREAIAAYLARSRGINVQPAQIIIGSGAEYLYSFIAQLLGKDNIFGLESPSYEKIRRVYIANGVQCDMLKMGRSGIRTGELERTKATVLHVTPYNSYPSGITASASKRNEYIRWAEKNGGYIIEDDFCSEFTISKKAEDTLFSLDPDRCVIYLNTFSKTIAPSFRAGYMILPKALTDKFHDTLGFYSCTVPVFEQYVIARLIKSGDFERHINRVRRKRRRELDEVQKSESDL